MKKGIKRYICAATVLLGCIGVALTVQATSFDCAKAQTKVEKLICADVELSKLDEDLAVAYTAALQADGNAVSIRQAKKQWLQERNGCADSDCVRRAYEARRHELLKDGAPAKLAGDASPIAAKVVAPPAAQEKAEICLAPKINWRNYEWTLITGKHLPVCQEMLAYVQSRPKDIAPPTCPEERLPPNGNWSRPETRILSEEERQALLKDVPERWRYKGPGSPITYEAQIRNTKTLRVIRGDITRDGVPESLLAYNGGEDDIREVCEKSKRCARPEEIFKKGVVLLSDVYDILPMNDAGTNIYWSHQSIEYGMPMGGELVFYKGIPYWMDAVSWSQNTHDDFTHYSMRRNDPYSNIFQLREIKVGSKPKIVAPHFKDVTAITMQYDWASNDVCRFGYFNSKNLSNTPPTHAQSGDKS